MYKRVLYLLKPTLLCSLLICPSQMYRPRGVIDRVRYQSVMAIFCTARILVITCPQGEDSGAYLKYLACNG